MPGQKGQEKLADGHCYNQTLKLIVNKVAFKTAFARR